MPSNLIKQVEAARRVSTPLIAINTMDPAATIDDVRRSLNGSPVFKWDVVNGLVPLNKEGQVTLASVSPFREMGADISVNTTNPADVLTMIKDLPAKSAIFYMNAHRYILPTTEGVGVCQSIWNLRDIFKEDFRTLFLLAPQITFPAELQQDILVLDEELPDDEAIREIITSITRDAGMDMPNPVEPVMAALRGIAAFPAEQTLAMSIVKDADGMKSIDMQSLWLRKKSQVEQTKGVRFYWGGPKFDEIGGNQRILEYITGLYNGNSPFRCVVFLDEVEKTSGGAGGEDSSGVNQDQRGTMLKSFDDLEAIGLMFVGHPGCGKSLLARAVGAQFGVPTIAIDPGATKGKWMGESEAGIRQMFKIIDAVAGKGGALFLATSNKLAAVPTELQRRFGKFGIYMFDFPSDEEKESIWKICTKRWKIECPTNSERPDDNNWSGADINNCCELAYRMATTVKEAAEYITPVYQTNPEQVKRLRIEANGKYRNPSAPGKYAMPFEEIQIGATRGVAI